MAAAASGAPMLERSVRILAALEDGPLTKSRLQAIVLRPHDEKYTWHRWQPALGLLRRFSLVLVEGTSSEDNPVYVRAPIAADIHDVESLKQRLLWQAQVQRGHFSELQRHILEALVGEAGRATIEELRRSLRFGADRGWEQVYQAIADLAGMRLVVEISELPNYQPTIRLTNLGWVAALEPAERTAPSDHD